MVTRAGTGSSSSDNPCSLTFNFAPEYIYYCFSIETNAIGTGGPNVSAATSTILGATMSIISTSYDKIPMMTKSSSTQPYVKKSSDGKTIHWYLANSSDQNYIYNTNAYIIYAFVAIV